MAEQGKIIAEQMHFVKLKKDASNRKFTSILDESCITVNEYHPIFRVTILKFLALCEL